MIGLVVVSISIITLTHVIIDVKMKEAVFEMKMMSRNERRISS
jgi:hypothetical protein